MKRILLICDQNPFKHDYGSQQRSGLLLHALCMKGQVDLVCFTSETPPQSIPNSNCSVKYFRELPIVSRASGIKRLRKLNNILFSFSPYSVYEKNRIAYEITHSLIRSFDYDYIVVRYIRNAFMCGLFNDKRIVVDIDDLPEQLISSYVENKRLPWFRQFQYRFYAIRAKFHTDRFIKGIFHSFCSNSDQCKWSNSSYLPNIPFPFRSTNNKPDELNSSVNESVVLFVGYMVHNPNSQGVQYFLDNIWGIVKKTVPNAIFKIVGKGVQPDQKNAWEKYDGVMVLGFVSDILGEYRKCSAVAVPIYFGAGSNIKVLEAMAMNKAIVISKFAANSFKHHLVDTENILIALDNHDFAAKLIKLLIDDNYNNYIAENGAKIVTENYSYSNFESSILKVIN